jgi:hypothetical protein
MTPRIKPVSPECFGPVTTLKLKPDPYYLERFGGSNRLGSKSQQRMMASAARDAKT